ncbi:hypothetical protein STRIP9103_05225 [Streptomyces ipomoeae 91-03]|uniref:Uncharacterized protein n=1 Tax=Streptomyces ipomoeae 91-03 TaxID=698759 RepID=L1KX82_9ACTN|nr:hypothetical protein STRIP9103_05225 [Streptomyces ipomoeae 91-03]
MRPREVLSRPDISTAHRGAVRAGSPSPGREVGDVDPATDG